MSVYVKIFFGIYKVKCKGNKSFTSITRCKPMTPCQSNARYSCENATFSPAEDTDSVQMCQTAFRGQLMVCCFKEKCISPLQISISQTNGTLAFIC